MDFMKRLAKDSPCRVFLIVDNLRVHHAKILDAWLEENGERIKLFYLPSYSPELNPDEYLNRDVKASLAEKRCPHTAKALEANPDRKIGHAALRDIVVRCGDQLASAKPDWDGTKVLNETISHWRLR